MAPRISSTVADADAAGAAPDLRSPEACRSPARPNAARASANAESHVRGNRFMPRPYRAGIPAATGCGLRSIEPLHAHALQCAVLGELDGELHRPATDLAVLDVSALAGAQIDVNLESLPAPRTLNRHELLR